MTAAPAHEGAERKRETETVRDGNEGFQELLEEVSEGEITGASHLHVSVTVCER